MENLIYIHQASSQTEDSEENFSTNLEYLKLFQSVNWKKVSTKTCIHLFSLAIALSTIGIATQAMAQMTQGSRGPEVAQLQEKLQKLGYFDRRPTGHFGPLTKKAVIRFQQDQGITANGIVETTTITALEQKLQENTAVTPNSPEVAQSTPEVAPTTPTPETRKTPEIAIDPSKEPILRRGAIDPEVKTLQQLLINAGAYNGEVNGKFDITTSIAVKQFQRTNGLTVDGIVGFNTWTALAKNNTPQAQAPDPTFNNSPFTNGSLTNNSDKPESNNRTIIQATLQQGDRGQDVKALQERLQALGYYRGNTTGNFGPLTKEAVIRFQKQAGLTPNGIVDSSTKTALITSPSIRNTSVSQIQARLKERGFYQGPVNGIFSEETKTALKAAQKAYGVSESDLLTQP
ncbi:peptidoglycan-binding domain-containing protein [Floridanema evergladense]|uniref:Peptidoglycan-binding protein n=1 Tax=Floridaenema evergladense BLCC-F167 TaxID=3153639 RepID=A0ABV4WIW6_9CYAN